MMALGRLPEVALEGAVYVEHDTNNIITFKGSIVLLNQLLTNLIAIEGLSNTAQTEVQNILDTLTNALDPGSPGGASITPAEVGLLLTSIGAVIASNSVSILEADLNNLLIDLNSLQAIFSFFDIDGGVLKPLEVPIPNEPWTPILEDVIFDYTASATIEDIDLIHLYPYAGTHLHEELGMTPTLLPTHCDEGTLFLGLKELVPNSNLNILFQLAEATADSEMVRVPVQWHYLDNNQWRTLRLGFEVLDDATDGLTTSGIVKFAIPENITTNNTVMPKGLHWIKASVTKNSRSISETIGIHTQAIRATFTNRAENYKLRLDKALTAGKLNKLSQADALVKKIQQPYDSFQGRLPETEGHYYVRVSELLRHKGRAIQKFDYERLSLEAFPQIWRVKCIQHSFGLDGNLHLNDFPMAPGYVLLAVAPDIRKLQASQSFEPKVPVSTLDNIYEFITQRTSPFVRLKVKNPWYQKVNFRLEVKLYQGKDENYYQELLMQELREFLAPWVKGAYQALIFGKCVYRSDIVEFLETRDYLDYIINLEMAPEDESPDARHSVCPSTTRSILIAGDIDLCITQTDCERWGGEPCENPAVPVVDYCNSNG